MNYEYFIEDGKFKAKRLPSPKRSVKIKDCTDLSDLREELRESWCIQDAVQAYEFCFSESYLYSVEVETFEEYFNRNPNKFLGDVGRFKGNYDLFEELREWDDSENDWGWSFVNRPLGLQLKKRGLVEVKDEVTHEDWLEYFFQSYKIQDMKRIGENHSISLRGKHKDIAIRLTELILSGTIDYDQPILIRPGRNLDAWYRELQHKYVDEVAKALSDFDYPKTYIGAVWEEVVIDNSEHNEIVETIKQKYDEYLSKEYPVSGFVPEEIDLDHDSFGFSITTGTIEPLDADDAGKAQLTGSDLEFRYINRDGERSKRVVNVAHVWKANDAIYFRGYCNLRKESRVFRVKGIEGEMLNLESGEIGSAQDMRSVQNLRKYLGMFGD